MIILGLDPGTAITGYGIINAQADRYYLMEYGCLRTSAQDSTADRLERLYDDLRQLLATNPPDQVAIEQLFFNRNTTTAVPVGQARGVLLLACNQSKIPISEYTPLEVKQALTGYGLADKQQIQYMVAKLLKLSESPKPDDAADALAIAITHAHYYRGRQLRGEIK